MTTAAMDSATIYYDYSNQAWVINGHYVACNHPGTCYDCYGSLHEGERA